MKKYITKLFLSMAALCMCACDDYLTLEPLNEVVLENFWQDKSDVESVVASCYYNLCSSEVINRMFVWGELRSDNVVENVSIGEEEKKIMEANILPEHAYASWRSFYNVINLCNTVLYYAPGVQDVDQTFTNSELHAYESEVLAIRALCYFYLIRTFYEIPLVLDATIGDDIDFEVEASSFEVVMAQIIKDLRTAEESARTKYTSINYTKGRITKQAIQAILADAYLWNGDYELSAEYCQKVIDAKKLEAIDCTDYLIENADYPLLQTSYLTIESYAYTAIFGTGNSFESIFELQFLQGVGQSNGLPAKYFGTSGDHFGPLAAYARLAISGDIYKSTDMRRKEFLQEEGSGVSPICKYASTQHYANASGNYYIYRSANDANWIIYRLTDVMLMKAEALALKENTDNASLWEAFRLVSAVYNRSNPGVGRDTLAYGNYNSAEKMETLVFNERQRELAFEGKRWYDLVRMVKRDGKNDRMLNLVIPKFNSNQTAIKSKMTSPYTLYFPISAEELKANKRLTQNPAYTTEITTVRK